MENTKTKIAFPNYAPNTQIRYEGIYVFKDFLQQSDEILSYVNAVEEFVKTVNVKPFSTRVKKIMKKNEASVTLLNDEKVKNRLFTTLKETGEHSPQNIAVIYLFAADEFLWERCNEHIQSGKIHFDKINIRDIETQSYAVYKTAQQIIMGRICIKTEELCDPKLISDDTLLLIINSFLICRNGFEFLLRN